MEDTIRVFKRSLWNSHYQSFHENISKFSWGHHGSPYIMVFCSLLCLGPRLLGEKENGEKKEREVER